jgi:hypothetical protein
MKIKKVIHKNDRRPFPYFDFFIPVIIFRNKSYSISKYFKFDSSTLYHFEDEDQYDINKLMGFSIGMHHNNSFRFGWRPNKDLSKMEIVGYEYLNKLRIPELPICEVKLDKWYKFELKYIAETGQIEYVVTDGNEIFSCKHPATNIKRKFNLGYKLYLYFGGNKKAPHDMIIYQDNE